MLSFPKIILASQSPARAKVLGQIQIPFLAIPSKIDENSDENKTVDPQKYVLRISQKKVTSVAIQQQYEQKNYVIVGCDTVVVSSSNTIIGKPKNREEAAFVLRILSGDSHTVITGCTIVIYPDKVKYQTVVSTVVNFRTLVDEEINYYLEKGEWKNKAGGYAIQGLGAILIDKIEGDYYNIVGLPVSWIWQTLWNHYGKKLLLIKKEIDKR
ncbi:MAG: septum formation protein Maf [Candidatus Heimdallarchaeota archaeon]|nr:MAG: septum formation protein Maf [Candidatus Heimdallarchaeota archaeon]